MERSGVARRDVDNLVRSRPSLSLNARRRSGMGRSRAASRDMMTVVVADKQHQTALFDEARSTARNNNRGTYRQRRPRRFCYQAVLVFATWRFSL
jgi:hypothetical protein